MIYEALNNCGNKSLRLIIVLNDNEMSISKNVGAVSSYFSRFRTGGRYLRFKRVTARLLLALPLIAGRFSACFAASKTYSSASSCPKTCSSCSALHT